MIGVGMWRNLLALFAQTAEAVELAKKASDRLMVEWGVAGVLVLVIVVSSATLIFYFTRALSKQHTTMTAANAAQRAELLAVNKDIKDSFIKALKEERESSAREREGHRQMTQLLVDRLCGKPLESGHSDG